MLPEAKHYMYLEEIINILKEKEISLNSCTDAEIFNIERKLNIKLPQAYKEFLKIMGNGAGKFFAGSDCFLRDDLIHLNLHDAKLLLEENDFHPHFLNNTFVFWMHQGYQMAFFKLNEGENPKVHFFTETATGKGAEVFIENDLKSFLKAQLKIEGIVK